MIDAKILELQLYAHISAHSYFASIVRYCAVDDEGRTPYAFLRAGARHQTQRNETKRNETKRNETKRNDFILSTRNGLLLLLNAAGRVRG